MWAGAHVRPIPASTPQLRREARWLRENAAAFKQLLEDGSTTGVTSCMGIEYLDDPPIEYQNQTTQSFTAETGLSGYRQLSASEMPEGVKLGFEYQTYCVNSPLYCGDLLRKFITRGGKTLDRDLRSAWEGFTLRPKVLFVVNATGTGFGDLKTFPTRGQTVVTNLTSATKTVTRQNKDGTWSFIIPRFFNGGTVIGGTKDLGSWQSEPSLATRERLLQGGKELAPYSRDGPNAPIADDAPIGVITDVVGRRPTREGGMRIEIEERQFTGLDGQLKNGPVVHAYGAGGRGFEIGWGVAREVAAMAAPLIPSPKKTSSKL